MSDFIDLFRHHSPRHVNVRAIEHHILDGTAQDVHRVVSPLAMDVAVPHDARAVFAGLGDRLAPPEQAHRLWTHWEEPETCWFPGNHVGLPLVGQGLGLRRRRLPVEGPDRLTFMLRATTLGAERPEEIDAATGGDRR